MLEVQFKDGHTSVVDADTLFTPEGQVLLTKRIDGKNVEVASYLPSMIHNVVDAKITPVKEMAIKLLTACSKTEPHGSRWLAQSAGIEYSDIIVAILKKLRDAGKVIFADGKWTRA